jgi:Leucine-rich repeat (LRR) protein
MVLGYQHLPPCPPPPPWCPQQKEQLGGPAALPSIRALDLSGLRIRDTGAAFAPPGTPFAGLTELVLDDNALAPPALPALAGLTALCVLRLSGNRLGERGGGEGGGGAAAAAGQPPAAAAPSAAPAAELEAAAQQGGAPPGDDWRLPSVCDLQLRFNGLASLAPLQLSRRAPALRHLDVAGNELSRLEGLEGLPRLRELVVSRNRLRCPGPAAQHSVKGSPALRGARRPETSNRVTKVNRDAPATDADKPLSSLLRPRP